MKSVPSASALVLSFHRPHQAPLWMKTWLLILACLLVISFFASPSLAQAPGWSRGQQLLSITYEEGVRRAPLALRTEGYRIDYNAGAFSVGVKNVHTAVIMCNPAPEGKLWINIVVSSNGEGGGVERQALQARMEQQLPDAPPVEPTNPPANGAASLRLDKATFAPGEEIKVYFTAPDNYPSNAWVGLIPSNVPHGDDDVNDQNDIAYQYLQTRTTGTMTFTAPARGSWDFRLNDRDGGGKEVASVSFTVQ